MERKNAGRLATSLAATQPVVVSTAKKAVKKIYTIPDDLAISPLFAAIAVKATKHGLKLQFCDSFQERRKGATNIENVKTYKNGPVLTSVA